MKLLLTIVPLLLILSSLQAQSPSPPAKKESKFFAGLSLGPSFPTGKFAGKNFRDTVAGLAQAGPSLSLSGGYMFTRSVGVVLLLGAQENRQDPGSLTSYLKQQYGDTIGTSVTTHNWKIARILAGGIFKFPLAGSGKLFFQAKTLAGFLKTSVPGYSYRYGTIILDLNNPNNFNVSASSSGFPFKWVFCYQANARLGWQLTRCLSLVGDISYFQARPVYKQAHFLIYTPNGGGGVITDRGPYERKYNVSSINLMAGAEIRF